MHGDTKVAECKFVGSTDAIVDEAPKSEHLYVKDCQDLEQLAHVVQENVTETLDLLEAVFRQLTVNST